MPDLDFAEFYSASFRSLTAQLHAFVGDHAEAQDLVQEAFCRAYARWRTVSRFDDPISWVRRVAWNLAVSRWRGRQRLNRWRRDLVQTAEPGPEETDPDLIRALAALPRNHRQAVVLHYLGGFSVREVAEFCGVAEGTVKSWLLRGRTRLHELLALDTGEVTSA